MFYICFKKIKNRAWKFNNLYISCYKMQSLKYIEVVWWANFLLSSWISCLLLISCHRPAFLSFGRTQVCLAIQLSAAVSCTAVYMILAHTCWTSEEYYESQWSPLTQPQYKLTKVPLGSVTSWGFINHFVRHGVISLRSPLSRHHFVVFFQEAASVFLKAWHVPYTDDVAWEADSGLGHKARCQKLSVHWMVMSSCLSMC